MFLNNIKIVLNRVSEAGNVGAVCRVMKNMSLSSLRLAAPAVLDSQAGSYPAALRRSEPAKTLECLGMKPHKIHTLQNDDTPLLCGGESHFEKIFTRAVNSFDIWENAQIYENLADSVADCSIVVGTTSRRGSRRKSISMSPRELASWLAGRQGSAAIVFGNERTGLETEELKLCNFASHIPVNEAQPSLNLSHAVQIYAYELFLALERQKSVKGEWNPMPQSEISALAVSITDTLEGIGFYKIGGKDDQRCFLRDLISRAGLSAGEAAYFKEIFVKTARLGGRGSLF